MEIIIVSLVALFSSLLTFFSGFGLGTLLLPAFAFFFPLPVAVALTAVVHFCNNLFKTGLIFRHVNWKTVWSFGLFSVPAAVLGAFVLKISGQPKPLLTYELLGENHFVSLQGILIGVLMIFFASYEFFPFLETRIRPGKNLWLGGLISGFFGGLTGHQGALRSAWLIRFLTEKQVYIATGTMIACLVDISRLSIYWRDLQKLNFEAQWQFLFFSALAAFSGALLGNKLLKKITLRSVKVVVCVLLLLFGLLTALGLLSK